MASLLALVLAASSLGCESPVARTTPIPAPLAAPADPALQVRCPGGLLCEANETLCGWRVPALCERRVAQSYLCTCRILGAKPEELREFFGSRYQTLREAPAGVLELELPQPPVFPGGPAPTPATLRLLPAASAGGERLLVATPAGVSKLVSPTSAAPGKPIGVE